MQTETKTLKAKKKFVSCSKPKPEMQMHFFILLNPRLKIGNFILKGELTKSYVSPRQRLLFLWHSKHRF